METHIEPLFINLTKQLSNFWQERDNEYDILEHGYIEEALVKTINCLGATQAKYSLEGAINYLNTSQYAIFLYYLSHALGKEEPLLADKVYYLNKIMHSVDWYWGIILPDYFYVEHPLGSILGRAEYQDYLMIYQGVTIGGNRNKYGIQYPKMGKYNILYANTTILGKCEIGDKVVFSANTYVKEEVIPGNCIVSGASPNLMIKRLPEEKVNEYIRPFWKDGL